MEGNTQKYDSAGTSLNQVPALIKIIEKREELTKEQVLLDYGGGKYDKAKEYIEGTHKVHYFIYDPYNRSKEHNKAALAQKADIVMLSNVLNVIREPDVRQRLLRKIKKHMKPGARLYVRVYNAPKSAAYQEDPHPGQPTKGGTCWQNCQPLSYYYEEIRGVLPNISIKKGYLVTTKD